MSAEGSHPQEPPLRQLLLNPTSLQKMTTVLAANIEKGSVFLLDSQTATWMDTTLAGALASLTGGSVLCISTDDIQTNLLENKATLALLAAAPTLLLCTSWANGTFAQAVRPFVQACRECLGKEHNMNIDGIVTVRLDRSDETRWLEQLGVVRACSVTNETSQEESEGNCQGADAKKSPLIQNDASGSSGGSNITAASTIDNAEEKRAMMSETTTTLDAKDLASAHLVVGGDTMVVMEEDAVNTPTVQHLESDSASEAPGDSKIIQVEVASEDGDGTAHERFSMTTKAARWAAHSRRVQGRFRDAGFAATSAWTNSAAADSTDGAEESTVPSNPPLEEATEGAPDATRMLDDPWQAAAREPTSSSLSPSSSPLTKNVAGRSSLKRPRASDSSSKKNRDTVLTTVFQIEKNQKS